MPSDKPDAAVVVNPPVSETAAYPPWRAALTKFLAAGFRMDDPIPDAWFFEAFGIELITPDMLFEKGEKLKLLFVGQFEKLREELLNEYQMDLTRVRSFGYRIVPPGEQTSLAYEDGLKELRKCLRKMAGRIANVDTRQLTADQRRQQVETMARLCRLREIEKEARKWPGVLPAK